MAGSQEMIVHETDNAIPATIRSEWKIQYARFFNYPSSSTTDLTSPASFCTDLHRRRVFYKPNLSGTWLSTSSSSSASLQLISFDHPASDFIFAVSLDRKVLEEHFLSKLHFTWPHVSCVSGFPARGSKVVFGSFIDSTGEAQKFAMRFLSTHDSKEFTNAMKPSKENAANTAVLPSHDIGTEFSSQSEFVKSHVSPYRPCEEFNFMTPVEPSRSQMHYSLDYEVEQFPSTQPTQPSQGNAGKLYTTETDLIDIFEDTGTGFPPSFTSLLTNCCSDINNVQPIVDDETNFKSQIKRVYKAQVQPAVHDEVDFKSQVAKYMEDSSFINMLGKVEQVVNELEDDLMRPSSIKLH